MKKKKKLKNKIILMVLILLISVGYALLSTKVSIRGTGKIKNARWDIHLENIQVSSGSVSADQDATIDSSRTGVDYSVALNVPGDYYEFYVDVVNDGSIDGMVDNVLSQIKINDGEFINLSSDTIPGYLYYKVTYSNGSEIQAKHELKAGEVETYKVRVEFRRDIEVSDLPDDEQNLEFNFSINYVQEDNTSVEVPKMEVGKYVSLTPDASTYTVSMNDTGYSEDQTISPNELNLWRIIRKNDDGTYDAISEYVSSKDIVFNGADGYANIVDTLQNISSAYQKSGYTVGSRMFGYNHQTLKIDDTTYFDGSTNSQESTVSSLNEEDGDALEFSNGVYGDTLYLNDYKLVKNVYNGNLKASKANSNNTISQYYLCSRNYSYSKDTYYSFSSRIIDQNGKITYSNPLRSYTGSWMNSSSSSALRPIITLKDNIGIVGGAGSLDSPYVFE